MGTWGTDVGAASKCANSCGPGKVGTIAGQSNATLACEPTKKRAQLSSGLEIKTTWSNDLSNINSDAAQTLAKKIEKQLLAVWEKLITLDIASVKVTSFSIVKATASTRRRRAADTQVDAKYQVTVVSSEKDLSNEVAAKVSDTTMQQAIQANTELKDMGAKPAPVKSLAVVDVSSAGQIKLAISLMAFLMLIW